MLRDISNPVTPKEKHLPSWCRTSSKPLSPVRAFVPLSPPSEQEEILNVKHREDGATKKAFASKELIVSPTKRRRICSALSDEQLGGCECLHFVIAQHQLRKHTHIHSLCLPLLLSSSLICMLSRFHSHLLILVRSQFKNFNPSLCFFSFFLSFFLSFPPSLPPFRCTSLLSFSNFVHVRCLFFLFHSFYRCIHIITCLKPLIILFYISSNSFIIFITLFSLLRQPPNLTLRCT